MKKLCLAISLAFLLPLGYVAAEDPEPSHEEIKIKQSTPDLTAAMQELDKYMIELEAMYPDREKVDDEELFNRHGEELALRLCAAMGMDYPCTLKNDELIEKKEENRLVLPDVVIGVIENIIEHVRSIPFKPTISVLQDRSGCPSDTTALEIYHDDEDKSNANSRWGWLGNSVSTNNTRYRFCKLTKNQSSQFKPINQSSSQYNYAVLKNSWLCPSGSHHLSRGEEGELLWNANSYSPSSTDILVSFRAYNMWHLGYCVFNANTASNNMSQFPNLGFPYGVFAPTNMPAPYALANGYIYQDDEDWLNLNFWVGGTGGTMGGGTNTWRGLAKVR